MKIQCLVFISFTLISSLVIGQDPLFYQYSEDNNIPSDVIYDLYQAKDGKIWMTSDFGISSWDGKDSHTYRVSDSAMFSAYSFFPENESKVWVSISTNQLYWFNPLSRIFELNPYEFNDSLSAAFEKYFRRMHIRQMWRENEGFAFSFLENPGTIFIDNNGEYEFRDLIGHAVTDEGVYYTKYGELFVFQLFSENDSKNGGYLKTKHVNDSDRFIVLNDQGKKLKVLGDSFPINTKNYTGVSCSFQNDSSFVIAASNSIIVVKNNEAKQVVLSDPIYDLIYYENYLLAATTNGLYFLNNELSIIRTCFKGVFITSFLESDDKSVWCSTLGEGLIRMSQIESVNLGLDQSTCRNILKTVFKNDHLFVFTASREMFVFNAQGDFIEKIEDIIYYNETIHSSSFRGNLSKYFGDPVFSANEENTIYHLRRLTEETVCRTGKKDVAIYESEENIYLSTENLPVLHDVQSVHGNIFASSDMGLFIKDDQNRFESYMPEKAELKGKVRIEEKTENGLLIRNQNAELYFVDVFKEALIDIPSPVGGRYLDAALASDSVLWILYSTGVFKYTKENTANGHPYTVQNFGQGAGILNERLIEAEVGANKLWFRTRNLLGSVPLFSLDAKINLPKYKMIVDSILVDGVRSNNYDKINILQDESIEVSFSQVDFNDEHIYEYRIIGQIDDWTESENGRIFLNNLAPGSFKLECRVKGQNTGVTNSVRIGIEVSAPFYKSQIAYWIYFFIFLLITIFIFRFLQARLRKLKDDQILRLNLELKVLMGQMNPHFTFNTINSIQSFIVENNKKEALDYLSDFAGLIRKTLDYSRNGVIGWNEEKEFLQLYVGLEEQRFNHGIKLQFKESLSYSDNHNILFPPLLLQPIVENSIIHGIQKIDQLGLIEISIEEKAEMFYVSVADNGPGIVDSSSLSAHQSHGLDILLKRLEMYNKGRNPHLTINKRDDQMTEVKFRLIRDWRMDSQ